MRSLSYFYYFFAGLLLLGCSFDPAVEKNDPQAPQITVDISSRISAELTISMTEQIADVTFGTELIRIIDGEESTERIVFQTERLEADQSYTWLTSDLQPDNTYTARSFITNGRNRKYSGRKTFTTPSTSKATLTPVTLKEDRLTATIIDDGGRTIEDVGFIAGDTPDRKALMRKEKIPAERNEQTFSLPTALFKGGKSYFFIAYAIDDHEDVGYSSVPLEFYVPQNAESVSLDRESVTLEVGTSEMLHATVLPEDATDKTVEWSSSDSSIASVEDGVVLGISPGKTIITATSGRQSAQCEVTVVNASIPVSNVFFIETEKAVYVGESFTVEAYVSPEDATEKNLIWESSQPSVATVSQDGTVTTLGVGTCEITATATSGESGTLTCHVVSEAPYFPDPIFREYVYTHFDTNNDGYLSRQEALAVSRIDVADMGISTLKGIEYFEDLYFLYCQENNIQELDMSSNDDLQILICERNQLTSINVTKNPHLVEFSCQYNNLKEIDTSYNGDLRRLVCDYNQLTEINVTNNPHLVEFSCGLNQLSSIDISQNLLLQSLNIQYNELESLDISRNTQLQFLYCSGCSLTSLDVTQATGLKQLYCGGNNLTRIDLSQNKELEHLGCSPCRSLEELDVSNNTNLVYLYCTYNAFTRLDISNNPRLEFLECGAGKLKELDVSKNPSLVRLVCTNNLLTEIDVSMNPCLETLHCRESPLLKDIWLKTGQEITDFAYDEDVATIRYK